MKWSCRCWMARAGLVQCESIFGSNCALNNQTLVPINLAMSPASAELPRRYGGVLVAAMYWRSVMPASRAQCWTVSPAISSFCELAIRSTSASESRNS
eukprot:236151-Amphidinium_carterae.1